MLVNGAMGKGNVRTGDNLVMQPYPGLQVDIV